MSFISSRAVVAKHTSVERNEGSHSGCRNTLWSDWLRFFYYSQQNRSPGLSIAGLALESKHRVHSTLSFKSLLFNCNSKQPTYTEALFLMSCNPLWCAQKIPTPFAHFLRNWPQFWDRNFSSFCLLKMPVYQIVLLVSDCFTCASDKINTKC